MYTHPSLFSTSSRFSGRDVGPGRFCRGSACQHGMPREWRPSYPVSGGHRRMQKAPLQSTDLRRSFGGRAQCRTATPACILICGRAFAVAHYRVDVVKPRCTLPSQHPLSLGPETLPIRLLPNRTRVHTAPHVEMHQGQRHSPHTELGHGPA